MDIAFLNQNCTIKSFLKADFPTSNTLSAKCDLFVFKANGHNRIYTRCTNDEVTDASAIYPHMASGMHSD